MIAFKVYGYSDDLIEIEGDFEEEFNVYDLEGDTDTAYVGLYDGTVLRVRFDEDGIWRFTLLARGFAFSGLAPSDPEDEDSYSDVVYFTTNTLTSPWALYGTQFAR